MSFRISKLRQSLPTTTLDVKPGNPSRLRRRSLWQSSIQSNSYAEPPGREHREESAMERVINRLRSGDEGTEKETIFSNEAFLNREWVRPDAIFANCDRDDNETGDRRQRIQEPMKYRRNLAIRTVNLAETTIGSVEFERLRKMAKFLKETISVPKSGLTRTVMEKIHDKWSKSELVRLKFHESLARNMKIAHQIVECRTGGMVIWREGSVMVVFRGGSHGSPKSRPRVEDAERGRSMSNTDNPNGEEAKFDRLLQGLGPPFEEWWGIGVPPVDADLLPPTVPGFRSPLRLLPNTTRPQLTNAEMTNLRKLTKSIPCHFALGRNRNHQGLAMAISKLWEKSLVAKIAVKQGVQNVNNKLMAEEIKSLTGGVLLLRSKYFIVFYRGKDFLPSAMASSLDNNRDELPSSINSIKDNSRFVRNKNAVASDRFDHGTAPPAKSLEEFHKFHSWWWPMPNNN